MDGTSGPTDLGHLGSGTATESMILHLDCRECHTTEPISAGQTVARRSTNQSVQVVSPSGRRLKRALGISGWPETGVVLRRAILKSGPATASREDRTRWHLMIGFRLVTFCSPSIRR